MADVYTKLRGIIGNLVRIGGAKGPQIGNNSGVIEALANASALGGTYVKVRVADAAGDNLNDAINVLVARGRVADVSFGFVADPSPNGHSGEFGICQTKTSTYDEGDIVYDTGTAIVALPVEVATHMTTQGALGNGNITFDANSFYCRDYDAPLWTWTKKGGSSVPSGVPYKVVIDFTHANANTPVDSTAVIPTGAIVESARLDVTEAFNGTGVSIGVTANGSSPVTLIASADLTPDEVGIYEFPLMEKLDATGTGVVRVTYAATNPTTGEARLIVEYATPLT